MAEYYMTYNEISEELEKYLCQSKESSNICKYKAEVLAATICQMILIQLIKW